MRYERLAPLYDLVDLAEALYKRRLRPRLFVGLGGLVLDAGAGTGRNVPSYPEGVRVVGFDLSPAMLARARERGARLGKTAEFVAMDVLHTGFADRCFDAVVAAFLFGVLGERMQRPALTELARVCKPGGEIRILDYTMSSRPARRLYMTLWQPWQKLVYGGAFDRHTERYLNEAGLDLVREEFVLDDMIRILVARPAG
ncbi:MAG: class I SAM-dependent methyltransferase [Kiloniellaceae bacterium]